MTEPGGERILGLGRQNSLLEIAQLAAGELESMHGAALIVKARAPGISLRAERKTFGQPFSQLDLELAASQELASTIRDAAPLAGTNCSVTERQELIDVRCDLTHGDSSVGAFLGRLAELVHLPEVWHVRGEGYRAEPLSIERLFHIMAHHRASDLHLYPGARPRFRVDGTTLATSDLEPVSEPQILELLRGIAPSADWEEFLHDKQCSFNYHQLKTAFSRVSAFVKSGVPHLTIRFLPERIPTFEDLFIPRPIMERLAELHHGLVLVTGMTGSGKTTTAASLIDWINANRTVHIVTIEDPIEFVHVNKKSMVSQRSVGSDVNSFLDGVRAALRHDPDVIFIGEMRDAETVRAAIDAASTGHLVLATFHANTAADVVNRIVSFFPPVERDLVRLQLRDGLRCVLCQRLLPKKGGGRVPALEFLFNDSRLIGDSIQKGDSVGLRIGMQQTISASAIFEKGLLERVKEMAITMETAMAYATSPEILEQMRLGTYVPPTLNP